MIVDKAIIDKLIYIGNNLHAKIPPGTDSILGLKPKDINYSLEEWIRANPSISLDELAALLKGVVVVLDLIEIHPQLHRFEAMQIRWLYQYIRRKDFRLNSNLDLTAKLVDDLLSNTDRCDVPLGSGSNFGAKTYKELITNRLAYRRGCEYECDKLEERKEIAEVHRNIRRKQCKNTALYRNTLIHEKHIEKLKTLSVTEKLHQIANDDKYSVGFYPGSIAHEATYDVIAGLDENVKLMILAKLKGKNRGPWGRFKKRLLNSFRLTKSDYNSTPWDRNSYI